MPLWLVAYGMIGKRQDVDHVHGRLQADGSRLFLYLPAKKADMLSGAVQMDENRALRLDAEGAEKAMQRLTAFGESYDCFFRTLDEGKNVIVFMVPVSDSYGRSVRRSSVVLSTGESCRSEREA